MRARALFGLVTLLLSASCLGMESSSEDELFLKRPMNERREIIVQYPMEKQIHLYLLAMQKHPPDLGLADAVAKNGAELVPVLLHRIQRETSEVAKVQLIDVFERMQSLGYYAVASDEATMTVLASQVSAIKDEQWRAMSADLLNRIRSAETR